MKKHLDFNRIGLTALVNCFASGAGAVFGSVVTNSWNNLLSVWLGLFFGFVMGEYFTRRSFYYHNGEGENK